MKLYSYLNDHGGTDPNTAIGDQGSLSASIFPYLKQNILLRCRASHC